MAKYAFLNIPAHGHVNPTLAVVQELVSRGHQVSYYLTEEFREVVQATGATLQPYKSDFPAGGPGGGMGGFPAGGAGGFPAAGAAMFKKMGNIPPQLLEHVRAEQPDVIVYDSMCVWGGKVADELHIPAIVTSATFVSNEHFNMMEQMREKMKNAPGAGAMMMRMASQLGAANPMEKLFKSLFRAEQLNIVFLPKEFQPSGETFDDRYVFVGPSIAPRQEATDFPFDQLNSDLPLLYISLGSVFTNQLEFYKQCFAAFGDQPWQVVLTVGKNTDITAIGPVPKNFLISAYAPQLDLLPRTRLFVTHSGANSVMESLYFGVPMVLIPQQMEQQMHAMHVSELGLGIMLEKENLTPQTLREAVEQISNDNAYYQRTQLMQQSVRTSGGYQRAADAILQFTKEHAKVHQA